MTDSRVVVAVDLDEVLGSFVDALCAFHNETYGTTHTPADYFSYHFADVWDIPVEEATKRVEAFFASEHFRNIRPLNNAAQILRGLRDKCRFVVVSSRQMAIEKQTREWIKTHFDGIFEDVLLANHYPTDGSKPTEKSVLCKQIGAQVLIDDSPKYVHEAASSLKSTILFGDYAWNKVSEDDKFPDNMKRAHSWRQLAGLLHQLNSDGTIQPRDAIVVTNNKPASFFAESVRRTIENQPDVSITSVGPAISTAAEAVELLEREGDVKIQSYRTGADASAPNTDRQVRLTVVVHPTDSLQQKMTKQANEEPTMREERRQKARSSKQRNGDAEATA